MAFWHSFPSFLTWLITGTEKGAWIHIRGWKKRPQISVDRQILQLSQGNGMTIRHIERSRNLPDPEFLQKRQDEGLRTPVERDVSPSPLHVPPVTQHKENACPHTIWSLSQHSLFMMSLCQWKHSPALAFAFIAPLQHAPEFKVHFLILHILSKNPAQPQVPSNRMCFGRGRLHHPVF